MKVTWEIRVFFDGRKKSRAAAAGWTGCVFGKEEEEEEEEEEGKEEEEEEEEEGRVMQGF